MRGPVAPKDPVEKRSYLYVILDKVIAGRREPDGAFRDHIYLEGRLQEQIKFTSGVVDDEMLKLITSVKGFRQLVHSVGITLKAEDATERENEAEFQLFCLGNTEKYVTGSRMEMVVPCTGEEFVIPVDAFPVNEEDTAIGAFHITFASENKNHILTVKFYLNDGYEVPEIQVDPPVQFDTKDYAEMISHSLVSKGNNYRLKKVIERTKRGEEVTIAYIGGSITQGAGAKPINTLCYAYRSYEAFCKLFSPKEGENVHYVKAGVGGTCSELGLVRYDLDVTNNGEMMPDLVIIEYAVNDAGDETKGVCFESLVKKVLKAPNAPAVLLNFAVFMNDFNLQERLIPIGERYGLPMVSVKNAVTPQFEHNNVITKRQYFYDIFHPTNDGHRIMADCIAYLFEEVDKDEKVEQDIQLDVTPVYGTQFDHVCRFDRKDANQYAKIQTKGFDAIDPDIMYIERDMDLKVSPLFADNWMHDVTEKDAYFSMKLNCKNLLIVMKDSGDSRFGKADVFVDGVWKRTMNPLEVGWNHSTALIIIDEDESKEHEITVKMHPGEENKLFTIQAFGFTR